MERRRTVGATVILSPACRSQSSFPAPNPCRPAECDGATTEARAPRLAQRLRFAGRWLFAQSRLGLRVAHGRRNRIRSRDRTVELTSQTPLGRFRGLDVRQRSMKMRRGYGVGSTGLAVTATPAACLTGGAIRRLRPAPALGGCDAALHEERGCRVCRCDTAPPAGRPRGSASPSARQRGSFPRARRPAEALLFTAFREPRKGFWSGRGPRRASSSRREFCVPNPRGNLAPSRRRGTTRGATVALALRLALVPSWVGSVANSRPATVRSALNASATSAGRSPITDGYAARSAVASVSKLPRTTSHRSLPPGPLMMIDCSSSLRVNVRRRPFPTTLMRLSVLFFPIVYAREDDPTAIGRPIGRPVGPSRETGQTPPGRTRQPDSV